MIYLLWGLLNIGLFLFFVVTCFKATKLVREKVGLFAAIVFVFGLLSFIGQSNNRNDNNKQGSNEIKSSIFKTKDSLIWGHSYLLSVDLEKTLVSKYYLGIEYGKNKEGNISIPISAYSSTQGFISGANWKPISITVSQAADNNKLYYSVFGKTEWQLLGLTIYSQLKKYEGFAITK